MGRSIRSIYLGAAAGILSAGLAIAAQTLPASAAPIHQAQAASQAAATHTRSHPIPPGIRLPRVNSIRHGRLAITVPRSKRHAERIASGDLNYNGGVVQNAPTVYVLFWGSWWSSSCTTSQGNGGSDEGYLYNYFHVLSGPDDGWSPIMSQYGDQFGDVPTFPRVIWGGWLVDCNDPPQSATGTQLANEAAAYAQYLAGNGATIDSNTQVIVVSPSGTNPGGGFGSTYCAWHSYTAYSGGNNFSFTNLPYLPDQGSNCGANLVQGPFDGWSIVGGHEYAESVTDPFLSAWFDSSGSEIGDKCAWINLFAESMGGSSYAQQPLWDNNTSSCRAVTSIPDTVSLNPIANQSTNLGGSVSVQATASSSNGFTLSYSASGLPSGVSINPATGLISGTATFPGNFHVVVTAQDATLGSASQSFSWQVIPTNGAIKVSGHNAHCVDDQHGSLTNGTPVEIYGCNSTLSQAWAAFPGGSLRRYGGPSNVNTNKCVNIAGSKTANGTKINLATCTGAWNQVWVYHSSSRTWVNPHSGKCLADPGANLTNGVQLILYTCNGTPGEKWTNV